MVKRILIADDSVTIQKAFAMTFAGEDVIVTAARSADEGLALAHQVHPDLIIADGVMPGRTGYDLCTQIRADAALRGVPVYILASAQHPYDEVRGQSAGTDGHLLKPWDTSAFIEKVYAAAASSRVPVAQSAAPSLPASAVDDEDYGEISIESSGPVTPAPVALAPPAPRATASTMPAVGGAPGAPGMRPSLIPGLRPGAIQPARPGTVPNRPLAAPGSAPPRPSAAPVGRTMIGLPAAGAPIPGVQRPAAPTAPPMAPLAPAMRIPTSPMAPLSPPPSAPAMSFAPPPAASPRPRIMTPMPPPAMAPVRAREATPVPPGRARQKTPTPPPAVGVSSPAGAMPAAAAVTATVEQKLAAISAKGPEYEAIAKLSREIIEQVVWEVVPELAEAIIRERVGKLP